ncbi:MAG TPA: carboxypeptidase-like regulatory domain-containing protein, partial [Gemmatimonadaceae bacterium]
TPVLDTVRVVAQLHVLAGVVLDDKYRPIAGAIVDLIGSTHAETATDSGGSFVFTSVKGGKVVVRARKPEYEMGMHSVNLEDWRGLVLLLEPLERNLRPSKRAEYSGFGNAVEFTWKETQQRLAVTHGARAVIVTREELAPLGAMTLGQALRYTRSGALLAADLQYAGANFCVIEDGRVFVGPTTLDLYRAGDVAFVELYPPGTESSGSLVHYTRGGGCRVLRLPGRTRTSGVFYAVIWMR